MEKIDWENKGNEDIHRLLIEMRDEFEAQKNVVIKRHTEYVQAERRLNIIETLFEEGNKVLTNRLK